MRVLRGAIAIAALVAAPTLLQGQTVLGKEVWAGTGSSFGWWWHGTAGFGNYMGGNAYSAKFDFNASPAWMWPAHGTGTFGPAVDIFCIDFMHTANTSSSGYSAYFTKLSGPLTNTRSGVKTDYLKVAWLATQLQAPHTNAQRGEIHAAMWWIMSGEPTSSWNGTGSASNLSNYTPINALETWVVAANANYTSVNAVEWTVVTDKCVTDKGDNLHGMGADPEVCSQEFLTHNAVPEPATMILLGTGLLATLAMAGVLRRPAA